MNNDLQNTVNPLLSVIIPVYNTGRYLRKCLDSVLSQTYQNIEVVIIDNGSTDNSCQIIKEYQQKKGSSIVCVTHKENIGLFHARLSGVKASKGEYIAHLDSDDYVSVDFYRSLIYDIQKNDADIAIGNITEILSDDRKITYNYAQEDVSFDILENEEALGQYFEQKGLNHYWHVIWNKVYTKKLWDYTAPYYLNLKTHFTAIEDMAFSTILFFHAKKIISVSNNTIFWVRQDQSVTATKKLTWQKQKKNIEDLVIGFSFIEKFLNIKNVNQKYLNALLEWKCRYKKIHKQHISMIDTYLHKKDELYKSLDTFCFRLEPVLNSNYFFTLSTSWDSRYEEIKKEICKPEIKVVSFDIFDTLIVRPFLRPADLFLMLDDDFRRVTGGKTSVDFSVLRVEGEKKARELLPMKSPGLEDITLDEIYETICFIYGIPVEIAGQMKQLEVETEMRFCTVRKSAFELYEMALHTGKKVICVSDMYLPKAAVEKILIKNGYAGISKIYVSSETRAGKWGSMFPLVVSGLDVNPAEILHIGDNYETDFVKAKEAGLNAVHFIKSQDAFFDPAVTGNLGQVFYKPLPFWQDNRGSLFFLGIRVMVSLVANKYFDNPYRTFNRNTDFNADPNLIGYGAAGMYLFGVVTWLINNLKEKHYDKVLFTARDGYLPMEAYKILKPLYGNLPQEEYLHMSRQAILLLSVQDDLDIYKLHEIVRWENKSPVDVIPYLKVLFDIDENKLKILCNKEEINLKENFKNIGHYHSFITVCKNNFFNREKHREKLDKLRDYFNEKLKGNVCIFDIGYSAKPELYLSRLCGKQIDTYFINTWCDDGLRHSKEGEFRLITFLEYKPAINGFIDELIFSKMEGSCIAYDIEGDTVKPVIEEYNPSYPERFVIEGIQKSALCFIQDIARIFGTDIHKLWLQPYYTSLLFWLFFFSSKETDRNLFSCFTWEDDIGTESGSLITKWNQVADGANQHTLDELYSCSGYHDLKNAAQPDLSKRNKIVKLFYWFFFDRQLLKIKVNQRFKKNKVTLILLKIIYKTLRKIKRTVKR
jgi:glycosyltransferase involved in cell wall biosynthesis/FMN phosphatase YigB (HAD superfamily)